MTGRTEAGPKAGPDGVIVVRVGSERLRQRLLSMRDQPDFRERVNEAFALGVKELKARFDPPYDSGIPDGETDETMDGLYEIAEAVDRNLNVTEVLNDALCAFMDAYLDYPEGEKGHVPRFLLKPDRDDDVDAESGDSDDEP